EGIVESLIEAISTTLWRTSADRRFHLALAGGTTPRLLYRKLANTADFEAEKCEIYFTDERCVEPDDPDSNYGMACETLLSGVVMPEGQIHRMEAEWHDLKQAARDYDRLLRQRLPRNEAGYPSFDLILLGMGADGHTASLFPETRALDEMEQLAVANDSPPGASKRLTLTFPALNQARRVWFLVTGEEKAATVATVFKQIGGTETGRLPAARVHPRGGELIWFLDRSAAAILQRVMGAGN
ncbi:MAG: 6-phosphogluconolactonase, partial [bacterium]